jgi:hypothetical protein
VLGSLDGYMAVVVVSCTNYGRVQCLELAEDSVLMGQDGDPGLLPCFGRFDDLERSVCVEAELHMNTPWSTIDLHLQSP